MPLFRSEQSPEIHTSYRLDSLQSSHLLLEILLDIIWVIQGLLIGSNSTYWSYYIDDNFENLFSALFVANVAH